MRIAAAVVVALLASACSQQVYSPPAQAFALSPVHSLGDRHAALELEASRHAEIFDPAIHVVDGRYRRGIGNNAELSLEGAAHQVEANGTSKAAREFYSGRAGISVTPDAGDARLFAGAGGGFASAGGEFVAVDSGFTIGVDNCVLVPTFTVAGFASQPINAKPIDVSDDEYYETDTPAFTFGGVLRGGLRLSLSPSKCRAGEDVPWISAGMGVTTLSDFDSHAALIHIGLGVEVPL
jgi:hypothetical protein